MKIKHYSKNCSNEMVDSIYKIESIILSNTLRRDVLSYKFQHLRINIKDNEHFEAEIKHGRWLEKTDQYNIELLIPPDTSLLRFQHAIAHELMHLNFINLYILTDYCRSDETYAETAIKRMNANFRYGWALEEIFCNYFAYLIIAKLNNISYDEAVSKIPTSSRADKCLKLVENLIEIFNGRCKVYPPNELYDFTNPLLTQIYESRNLSTFIEEYDHVMGEKEMWKKLNNSLDSYFKTQSPNDIDAIRAELNHLSKKISDSDFVIYKRIEKGKN